MNDNIELISNDLAVTRTEILKIEEELKNIHIEIELKGSICFKFIRCGKPSCHCMNGGSSHGPYPHLQWWDNGKIKTKYLNKKNYPKYKKEVEKTKRMHDLMKSLKHLKKKERILENKLTLKK